MPPDRACSAQPCELPVAFQVIYEMWEGNTLERWFCRKHQPTARRVTVNGIRSMAEDLSWVRQLAATGAVRAIREAAALSASDVAREIGVSPSAVSRWERGKRRPHGEPAIRWARLLRRLPT